MTIDNRPLDLDRLNAYQIPAASDTFDPRDTILYALGTGAGLSPDVDELHFVFERHLVALPTMAFVLGTAGFWPMDPACGIDWINVLHGDQRLRLYEPLPPMGELNGQTRVTGVADKGPGKPALVRAVKELRTNSGKLIAEARETWVLRGAGGFGGNRNLADDDFTPVPETPPTDGIDLPTSFNQALVYRLSGDRNPLHAEPASARKAGFDQPILHGLSTMGLIARALIHRCCEGDATRLSSIGLRFTAPVLPGDTIRTEIWRQGKQVRFRALAIERGVIVADAGDASIDQFRGE